MDTTQARENLRNAGKAFGAGYQKLAGSQASIEADVKAAADAAVSIEVNKSGGGILFLHFLNFVLFFLGCVFFIIGFSNKDFWNSWLTVSFIWILGLFVVFIASASSGSKGFSKDPTVPNEFIKTAIAQIDARRNAARSTPEGEASARGPMPPAQPFGVSHEGAEALCAEWLKYLGELDAEYTRVVGDGGIDVQSSRYIGQVKNYSGTVGVASIRELAGVATVDGRRAVFFTSGTYASGSVSFANQVGMPLFVYNAVEGSLSHANEIAEKAIISGL